MRLVRKALKDLTFSDGTRIPAGTIVTAAGRAIHMDEANYDDAHTFKPTRFYDKQDSDGPRNQFVSTSTEYVAFGHGRHAWYVFAHLLPYFGLDIIRLHVLIHFSPCLAPAVTLQCRTSRPCSRICYVRTTYSSRAAAASPHHPRPSYGASCRTPRRKCISEDAPKPCSILWCGIHFQVKRVAKQCATFTLGCTVTPCKMGCKSGL